MNYGNYRILFEQLQTSEGRLGIPAQLDKTCHSEALNVLFCNDIAVFRILPI